jgi:starch phosphorylase
LDLHWAWNHAGDEVWRRLDEVLWDRTQNPWLLLQYVPYERLERLAADSAFLDQIDTLDKSRERYRQTPPWRPPGTARLPRVAYFSMEFGLHEALPLYSGGLGILAGDYLKTASDLNAPVIGIGILWQQGYFRQLLDATGHQVELYPFNEPAGLPVRPVFTSHGDRLRIALTFPDRTILLRVWQAIVGRTLLYLLDSNDPFNTPADRGLTSALYGGGTEIRLLQEIVLGIGGWRLIDELGLEIEVCHLNEGHAALVVVERARHFMQRHQTTFQEALWTTRAGNVFTTHTAVPAGFDTFASAEVDAFRPYFDEYVRGLDLTWPDLLGLGRANPLDATEPFNMAWLAVRGCCWVNGVSHLHGTVSRRLFAGLFPRRPVTEVPVSHVTNGVHVPSWDSPWTDALWTQVAGKERWRGDVSALTTLVLGFSDQELWRLRGHERSDLVRYARDRLRRRLSRLVSPEAATRIAASVLNPDALTLGFARRFASYKRPNLLLTDVDRLLALVTNEQRPVQLIVAGKAHPRDNEGKALIRQWADFAARSDARARVVFLEDYDMRLAAELVQGVDVWINTPRRPWEASGTSGMKILVNGGMNVSTLDGWWAEAYKPECGWAIGDNVDGTDDEREAEQLYAVLEDQVIPAFYTRDADGLPHQWLARMRNSMACLAPRFSSVRMLQQYVEQAYLPAASLYHRRADRANGVAQDLNRWFQHLQRHWSSIRFGNLSAVTADGQLMVSVSVDLGAIELDSVAVELYASSENEDAPFIEPMVRGERSALGTTAWEYRASVATSRPPEEFTPRVVPRHPEARIPIENPLIAWAR